MAKKKFEQARETFANHIKNKYGIGKKNVAPGCEYYFFEVNNGGVVGYGLLLFSGRKSKPSIYSLYSKKSSRNEVLERNLDFYKTKAQVEKNRKSFKHTLKVDDILYSTWGYGQTNVDFYQVTRIVGASTVEIREIANPVHEYEERDTGTRVPKKDHFICDPQIKRPRQGNYITLDSFSCAGPWHGRPVGFTSYH